jgi:FixJ family two-component response regulator
MTGIDVLEALRGLGVTSPVYIITGFYDEYVDTLQGLADKGVAFELLRKPLQAGTIFNVIQGTLNCP